MADLDIKLLELWTALVTEKCELAHALNDANDKYDRLKRRVLMLNYSDYDCRNYPQKRFDFHSSDCAVHGAASLIDSGLYTAEEIRNFIEEMLVEHGYEPYVKEAKIDE